MFSSLFFLARIDHGSRRKHRYLLGKSSIAAHDVFNSFKTPCVETTLYSEFSRSNRQANMSGRTMDAENHRLILISSPAYDSCLETTENCTLQIQRKYQVLFVYHVAGSPCPRPRVPLPRVPRLRVSRLRVPRLRVPRPRVPRPRVHIRESTSASPRPRVHVYEFQSLRPTSSILTLSPHVPVSFLVTASIFVAVWSFGGAGSFPYAVIFLIFGFPFFYLQNELLNRKSLPLVKKQPLPISRGVQHYLHFSVFF